MGLPVYRWTVLIRRSPPANAIELALVKSRDKAVSSEKDILDGGVEGWIFTMAVTVKCYREAARAETASVVVRSTLNERNFGSACNMGL